MKRFIEGEDRNQSTLFPECLDARDVPTLLSNVVNQYFCLLFRCTQPKNSHLQRAKRKNKGQRNNKKL
jgi:hypothetical protein